MGAQLVIPQGTVEAGGTLHGNLKFKLDTPLKFKKGLTIKLVGKEISRPPIGHRSEQHKWGRVNVHKQHITILGGPKGSNFEGELPPGDYDFPFAFQIPLDAPPSLQVAFNETQQQLLGAGVVYSIHAKAGGVVYRVQQRIFIMRIKTDITVVAPMPTSQYQTRCPVESKPSVLNRTGSCFIDGGTTEVQVKLPYNMYIYGKDASISGAVFINNSRSQVACQNIGMRLVQTVVKRLHDSFGKFEKQVKYTDLSTRLQAAVPNAEVAPSDQQLRQFDFVLPLPPYRKGLPTCYHGPHLEFFYELVVTIDGDTALSMPILMASGEDPTNRCPPIDMTTPRQAIAPGAYPKWMYPHGQVAGVVMPQQPPANIPPSSVGSPDGANNKTSASMEGGGGSAAPPQQQQGDNVYGCGAGGGLYGGGGESSYGVDGMMYGLPSESNTKKSIYDIYGPADSNTIPFGVICMSQ